MFKIATLFTASVFLLSAPRAISGSLQCALVLRGVVEKVSRNPIDSIQLGDLLQYQNLVHSKRGDLSFSGTGILTAFSQNSNGGLQLEFGGTTIEFRDLLAIRRIEIGDFVNIGSIDLVSEGRSAISIGKFNGVYKDSDGNYLVAVDSEIISANAILRVARAP